MHPTEPNIVAIETSGRLGSVAQAVGGRLIAERQFSHNLRHAAELMPTLEALCRAASWKSNAIDQIYVSTGPGSFTGLRIAISVARAISQATGCKLVSVPTVDVLAANAPPETEALAVILDAKRGQVFGAAYTRGQGDLPNGLRRIHGPALMEPTALIQLAGEGGKPVSVLGEGIDYHRPALEAAGATELPASLWPARAAALYQLGWKRANRGEFVPLEQLLPTYIRLAEAEEVWRKKHNLPI